MIFIVWKPNTAHGISGKLSLFTWQVHFPSDCSFFLIKINWMRRWHATISNSIFVYINASGWFTRPILPTHCLLSPILQIVLFQRTIFSNRHIEKHGEEETVITMRRPVETKRQTNRCIRQFWRADYKILQLNCLKKYNSHQTT